jgi:NodT family efflux transporter outer membrane factor (OMF) lipoprotein
MVYDDQVLDQLIALVDTDNYSLQGIEAQMRQARSATDIALAAQYPTVVAGGTNDLGIMANWEIDLWGRIQRNLEASGAAAQASAADLAAAKLSLQAQLAQNYFLLRIKDADIQLLQDAISSYKRSLKISQNQYAAGVADRSSISHAQVQLSTAQIQMHEAHTIRAQLEHSIAVMVGKAPADFSLAPITPIVLEVPEVPATLPTELLERRPDIAAAERRMAAASARIGVAAAEAYPTLNLFLGASIIEGVIGGAKTEMPLYTAGATKAKRTKAEAAYDEAVANYRQTVINGFREVEDNLVEIQYLDQSSAVQDQAVKSARESALIMNNQYDAGIVNYLSVVIVQSTALTHERGALSILGRRLVASVNLTKALGGGWKQEEPKIEKDQAPIRESTDK